MILGDAKSRGGCLGGCCGFLSSGKRNGQPALEVEPFVI
jgi:hypothetical protein